MATSIKDIYNSIIQAKDDIASQSDQLEGLGHVGDNASQLISELNSNSKVAIWRLWAYVTSVVIFFHEKLWDLFKADVEDKLRAIPGTNIWLARECKKFQYHETDSQNLVFNEDGSYGYEVVVSDNQIIKRVAVTSEFGATTVKVATQADGSETLEPLSENQLTAFQGFLQLIQYAGSSITAASSESDKVQLNLEIYHDALISLDAQKANVEAAISSYLSNLQFNGAFKVIRLIDAIQALEGITDITVTSIQAKPAGADSYAEVNRVYNPVSGYLEVVSSTLNFNIE